MLCERPPAAPEARESSVSCLRAGTKASSGLEATEHCDLRAKGSSSEDGAET